MKKVFVFWTFFFLLVWGTLGAFQPEQTSQGKRISAATEIDKILSRLGKEAAWLRYQELRALPDVPEMFIEKEFLALGARYMAEKKYPEAVTVLEMAADSFPLSFNALILLGQAHRRTGNHKADRKAVNKAFSLINDRSLKEFLKKHHGSTPSTAEDVIEKHLEAVGGREKLEGIQTMAVTICSLDSQNQTPLMKRFYKRPHFLRQETPQNGRINITDGTHFWTKTKGKEWTEELANPNWIYIPDITHDFIGYEKKGITYAYLGIEAIDGRVYHRLLKKHSDGEERDLYFSASSGLFRMERRDFGIGKDIKTYFDYRRVGEILYSHLIVVTIDIGFGQIHGGIITDIQLNLPLDDSFFRPSEKKK
jgi:hypothetical protein